MGDPVPSDSCAGWTNIHMCTHPCDHCPAPRRLSHASSLATSPRNKHSCFFYHYRLVLPALELHLNGIMQYVLICVQLTLLNIMPVRLICRICYFSWLYSTPWCDYVVMCLSILLLGCSFPVSGCYSGCSELSCSCLLVNVTGSRIPGHQEKAESHNGSVPRPSRQAT